MPYDWQGRQILYFDLLHPIGEYYFVNESPVIKKWAGVETLCKSEAFVVFVCSSHVDGQKLYSHVGIVPARVVR
jgi:hypothetical protein